MRTATSVVAGRLPAALALRKGYEKPESVGTVDRENVDAEDKEEVALDDEDATALDDEDATFDDDAMAIAGTARCDHAVDGCTPSGSVDGKACCATASLTEVIAEYDAGDSIVWFVDPAQSPISVFCTCATGAVRWTDCADWYPTATPRMMVRIASLEID